MAFTDDFTGDDNQDIQDRTGWSIELDGTYRCRIWGNGITFRTGGGGSGDSYWICTDQGSADHYTEFKNTDFNAVEGDAIYMCCRLVDNDNFLAWWLGGTGAIGSRLCKCVAGSITDLVTVQGAEDDVIKITCESNTIKFYIDDVQQGTDQTVTDHNTETSQGIVAEWYTGDATVFDDWEAGPMAAPPATLEVSASECE